MKKKFLFVVLIAILCLGTSGCFKTYQTIHLNADLSGSIALNIVYDLDAILGIISLQRGNVGKMTPEQKKMMIEQLKIQVKKQNKGQEEQIRAQLPKGIHLDHWNVTEKKDGRLVFKIKFTFDHVRRLKDLEKIVVKNKGQQQKMFGGLSVKEDPFDHSLVIMQAIKSNPGLQQSAQRKLPPKMQKIVDSAINGMGVYFRIQYPPSVYSVVKNTADRHNKNKHLLEWRFPGKTLLKYAKAGKSPKSIYVKLKRID